MTDGSVAGQREADTRKDDKKVVRFETGRSPGNVIDKGGGLYDKGIHGRTEKTVDESDGG